MSGMISLGVLLLWFGSTPVPVESTGLSASISGRGTTVSIGDNNGGSVITFAHRVLDLYNSKADVRIEGVCSSSCTLITALPKERVCIGPNARLQVHQASFPTGLKDPRLTQLMWQVYPSWIQKAVGQPDALTHATVDIDHAALLDYYGPCIE